MSETPIDTRLPRLMIIDDNPGITDIMETIAIETGFEVLSVNDYKLIHSTYREFNPELIFLDLDLGLDEDMDLSEKGYDGLTVFKFLEKQACTARIVLVSGMDRDKRQTTKSLGREMNLNVIGSVPKPFTVEKIEKLLMQLKRDQSSEEL